MNQTFPSHKQRIARELSRIVNLEFQCKSTESWLPEVREAVLHYSTAGKMLRGSLLIESWRMYAHAEGSTPQPVVTTAALVELIESALLIHDDFIDRDAVRRGMPAFHLQMQSLFPAESDRAHGGASAALLAGDMLLYVPFVQLSKLAVSAAQRSELVRVFSENVTATAFGEFADTLGGLTSTQLSKEEILLVSRLKTGRYSFSLPLEAGAVLAGLVDAAELARLRELGEVLGVLYQTVDDSFGLFGSTQDLGKEAGGDVREGKQTLYLWYAQKYASAVQRQTLSELYGKSSLTHTELARVQQLIEECGARQRVEQLLREVRDRAEHMATELSVDSSLVRELLALLASRKK